MKFHKIQNLRALAAILVAIDHSLSMLVGHGYTVEQLTPTAWFIGEQGVATFFVISGFIMTYTTRNKFGSIVNTIDFLRHRAIRVIPLYWLFTLAVAALMALGFWFKGLTLTAADLLRSLAFVPYGHGGAMRPILGQGWTLNYEMLFYALFAMALLTRRRVGLVAVCLVLMGASVAGVLWGNGWQGGDPTTVSGFYTSPLLVLFVAGIAIGDMAIHRPFRLPPFLARHGLLLIAAGSLGMALIFAKWLNTEAIPLPFRLTCWAVDALGVLMCVMAGDRVQSRAQQFWEWMGDASYSIYLTHFFALLIMAKVWKDLFHWHLPELFVVVAPCAGIVAGLIAHQLIEKPLTRLLNAGLGKARPATA